MITKVGRFGMFAKATRRTAACVISREGIGKIEGVVGMGEEGAWGVDTVGNTTGHEGMGSCLWRRWEGTMWT